jgi:hypothetical protein
LHFSLWSLLPLARVAAGSGTFSQTMQKLNFGGFTESSACSVASDALQELPLFCVLCLATCALPLSAFCRWHVMYLNRSAYKTARDKLLTPEYFRNLSQFETL